MEDKENIIKKPSSKVKIHKSLGFKDNLKKIKDLNDIQFNDYFSSWKEKKISTIKRLEKDNLEFNIENYNYVLDALKKKNLFTQNISTNINNNYYGKIYNNNNNNFNTESIIDLETKDNINKISEKSFLKLLKDLINLNCNVLIYGIGSKLELMYRFLDYFQNKNNTICVYNNNTSNDFKSQSKIDNYKSDLHNNSNYFNKETSFQSYKYVENINNKKKYYYIIVMNAFHNEVKLSTIIDKIIKYLCSFIDNSSGGIGTNFLNNASNNSKDEESIIYKLGEIEKRINHIRNNYNQKLLLIINNIDGPSFLGKVVQKLLSKIIGLIDVQLIATCDNLYTYYYWDQETKDNYSFYFLKYNTFKDYSTEICDRYSLTGEKNYKTVIGFKMIMKCLTQNQRKMIKLIAIRQTSSNKDNQIGEGLTFKVLTDMLIDEMIVTDNNQVKHMIIEPLDHNIIIERKNKKGNLTYRLNLSDDIINNIIDGQFDSL